MGQRPALIVAECYLAANFRAGVWVVRALRVLYVWRKEISVASNWKSNSFRQEGPALVIAAR